MIILRMRATFKRPPSRYVSAYHCIKNSLSPGPDNDPYIDRDNVSGHREEVCTTKCFDHADLPPRAQSETTQNDQQFLLVEISLSNESLSELPKDTLPGLNLGSGHKPEDGLGRGCLNSDIKKRIHNSVCHLIDEIIEAVGKSYKETYQREIEAQWRLRSEVGLRQQLAQQRDEVAKEHWDQNKKHWDATEGVRLKEHYKQSLIIHIT